MSEAGPNSPVPAFIERCRRITPAETERLAGEWAVVEDDPATIDRVVAARRAALALPGVRKAASEADWAFRSTLPMPGDSVIYAENDPIYGRAIQSVVSRVMAVAAGDAIAPDDAERLSAPWLAALGVTRSSDRSGAGVGRARVSGAAGRSGLPAALTGGIGHVPRSPEPGVFATGRCPSL